MTLHPYIKPKSSLNPHTKQRPFVEIKQFKFETLLQERNLSSTETAELNFGVCITNQSPVAQRFVLFYLKPIFSRLEVDRHNWKLIPYLYANYNGTWFPQSEDSCILEPGESIDFWRQGKFCTAEGELRFSHNMKDGGFAQWGSFNPGTHGLQCEYYCPVLGKDAENCPHQEFDYDDAWVGQAITPLNAFKLSSINNRTQPGNRFEANGKL